jgi:FkbM family methyltransferase
MHYVVAPGLEFQMYPKGELSQFLSLGPLFEATEMRLVASLLRPGMKVIDAGANIGLYSLLAAKRVEGAGHIWSFEPSQNTYRLFLDNLALNGITNVSPYQLALSDAAGELTLRAESGFGDLYRHLDYTGKATKDDIIETVTVGTLDDFAAAQGITAIDFLKIDVEGGEYRLLKGAQRLLSHSPGVIVMFESEEDWCVRSGCKTQDALDLLRGLGFGLYRWSKRQKRWFAIEEDLSTSRTVWASRNTDLLRGHLKS